MIQRFANPGRFLSIANAVLPWAWAATLLLFAIGLTLALYASPADYQQGETVRIMYVHVPAAWMALMVYSLMALASAVAIIFRHPLADVAAKTAAPIGAAARDLSHGVRVPRAAARASPVIALRRQAAGGQPVPDDASRA